MAPIKKIFFWVIAYLVFLAAMALFLSRVLILDQSLFLAINGLYNPYLETFFNLATYLGSSVFWIFLIILFWLKGKKKVTIHLIYALIINTILVVLLKSVFLRPRPFDIFNLGFNENIGPSFPSGHSELAFSGAYVLSSYYKKYSVLFYSLSFLVAFSRIYLGLHFPLDTLIGAINGILVGAISLAIPTKIVKR